MSPPADVRPSPLAGAWYPADPRELAAAVDRYLGAARPPAAAGAVVALVVPHAGHRYSGPVAGYAFGTARQLTPGLVAIVGPMHHPSDGALLTSGHRAYATPLGEVPIDADVVRGLDVHVRDELGRGLIPVRNDPEHSLEIELPFLQRALPEAFRLVPVMVHDQRREVARGLGRALARTLATHSALLIASTDLSHYYPQPLAEKFDAELLRRLEAFDPDAVLRAEEEGTGFACGIGALAAVLWAARELGADHLEVLRYATSGDATGDYAQVVGYAAAVVTRRRAGAGFPPHA
ncbi:MAG: AmmeMemoRadiSam system protein B [Candidatus Rokubacteria bacterium 13_1_40CM_69_27]|nr:MAG: AmmeMemoRadiSam system protein B [Candidatus Rokubacteria bacterium 13_1_40CM_69_27]OLC39241.1 MAG: AmmeMemoRadiSam system protein B [Candidatus Rokubacteria bacterium 13_1_40CM_4_69_5]